MKFLSRSTSLFLLFNWGMAMTSEVYPVGPGDRTGADFIGATVQSSVAKPLIHPSRAKGAILREANHPCRRQSSL